MNRSRVDDYQGKFGDFKNALSGYRRRERADCRSVDARFLMGMTQYASLIIRTNMPMHHGRKRRDGE